MGGKPKPTKKYDPKINPITVDWVIRDEGSEISRKDKEDVHDAVKDVLKALKGGTATGKHFQKAQKDLQALADVAWDAIDKNPRLDNGGRYSQILGVVGHLQEMLEDEEKLFNKHQESSDPPKSSKKWHKDVKKVMDKNSLVDDDAEELKAFKKAKPDKGKKLTNRELMQRFIQKAKPETKERMKDMSVIDFMVMYKSIMADEEAE